MREVVLAVITAAAIIAFSVFMSRWQCEVKAKAMGLDHRWGFVSGCLVGRGDGTFVPIENYRVIE